MSCNTYKKLLPLLWHNNTTWDENLIGKMTEDENGMKIADPVATEAVERFKEWIADVPRLKELRFTRYQDCLLYTSPSPRDRQKSRMPSSA